MYYIGKGGNSMKFDVWSVGVGTVLVAKGGGNHKYRVQLDLLRNSTNTNHGGEN